MWFSVRANILSSDYHLSNTPSLFIATVHKCLGPHCGMVRKSSHGSALQGQLVCGSVRLSPVSLQQSGFLGELWELPVVKLVEHSRVDSRYFLHREVNVVEAMSESVEEKAGDAAGDRSGGIGLGQLGQVQPLTAQTLLGAEVNVVGQWA